MYSPRFLLFIGLSIRLFAFTNADLHSSPNDNNISNPPIDNARDIPGSPHTQPDPDAHLHNTIPHAPTTPATKSPQTTTDDKKPPTKLPHPSTETHNTGIPTTPATNHHDTGVAVPTNTKVTHNTHQPEQPNTHQHTTIPTKIPSPDSTSSRAPTTTLTHQSRPGHHTSKTTSVEIRSSVSSTSTTDHGNDQHSPHDHHTGRPTSVDTRSSTNPASTTDRGNNHHTHNTETSSTETPLSTGSTSQVSTTPVSTSRNTNHHNHPNTTIPIPTKTPPSTNTPSAPTSAVITSKTIDHNHHTSSIIPTETKPTSPSTSISSGTDSSGSLSTTTNTPILTVSVSVTLPLPHGSSTHLPPHIDSSTHISHSASTQNPTDTTTTSLPPTTAPPSTTTTDGPHTLPPTTVHNTTSTSTSTDTTPAPTPPSSDTTVIGGPTDTHPSITTTTSHITTTTSIDNPPTSPPSNTTTSAQPPTTNPTSPITTSIIPTGPTNNSSSIVISFPSTPIPSSTDVLHPDTSSQPASESTLIVPSSLGFITSISSLVVQATTTDAPGFNQSLQPTATSPIIVFTAPSSAPLPSPTLPLNLPARIYPHGEVIENPDKATYSIVGILFDGQLNWPFVVGNDVSASQIFAYMPAIIARSLNPNNISQIATYALQVYVPSSYKGPQDLDSLGTQWLGYIPSDKVDDLANAIKAKNSPFYTGTDDNIARTLASHVNSAFPINSVSDPNDPPSSNTASNNTNKRLINTIIGVAVALGVVVVSVLGFLVYKSLKRRNTHLRLTDPPPDADEGMMPSMRQNSGVRRVPVPLLD